MEENRNKLTNPTMKNSNWGFMWEGFESILKSIVNDTMEEWWQNKKKENAMSDQNLTARELCERWKISDTTLLTWEKRGVISPLQMGGRKKVYSMRDIKVAEASGFIKNVA